MRKARKEELLHSFPAIPDEIMEQMKGRGAENFAVMLTWGRELFVRCYHRYSNGKLAERQRYVFADDGSVRYGIDNSEKWGIRKEFREPVFCKPSYGYSFDNSYTLLNRDAWKKSCMKYSQLNHYYGDLTMEYLHLYCKHRNLEYIMKSGYNSLLGETYRCFWGNQKHLSVDGHINWKSNNLLKMLNLNRTEFKTLQGNEEHYLDYLNWRETFPDYKPEELLLICKTFGAEHGTAVRFCKLTGLKPKRIARYLAENEICSHDYQDHLNQCRKLQYNLHDTAISMPHHFMDMHTRLTEIINLQELEKARKYKRKCEILFEKNKAMRDSMEYQSGNFMIHLPKNVEEIVQEGCALQHCVGGYAKRHMEGRLHILFIRKAEDPDKPFYTMEVNTNGRIIQVRGYKNCDPTPEISEFVEKYKIYLQTVFGRRKLMESVA